MLAFLFFYLADISMFGNTMKNYPLFKVVNHYPYPFLQNNNKKKSCPH